MQKPEPSLFFPIPQGGSEFEISLTASIFAYSNVGDGTIAEDAPMEENYALIDLRSFTVNNDNHHNAHPVPVAKRQIFKDYVYNADHIPPDPLQLNNFKVLLGQGPHEFHNNP